LEALRSLLARPDTGPSLVDYRGMWDNTPLMSACQYRHEACAIALIQAGANVNAVNERGNTALLHASLEGLSKVVPALLQAGARGRCAGLRACVVNAAAK
jgi:ankyrin repeat protein